MAVHLRTSLARSLAAGMLLLSGIGVSYTGGAHAAASNSLTRYARAADHYSLSYPSTWKLQQQKTASTGKVESGIGPTEIQISSPDQVAAVAVVVGHSATAGATLKAKATALLAEDMTIIGGVKYSTGTISGMQCLVVAGTARLDATHQAQLSVEATSHGNFTYYVGIALVLKQKTTTQERAALAAILASFKMT